MEEAGDDFGVDEEEMDDDEDDEDGEADSAFASSNEDEDVAMADVGDDPLPPHLRPNPIPRSDDEDGAITTNLEDDLENEGYTLPAVDRGGEVEDFETGTSLREVEGRMRWLVGVCMGKDEKASNGVPGKYSTMSSRMEYADDDAGLVQITYCNYSMISQHTSDTTHSWSES